VLRARQIGLNGLREHVKVESPRKLYWADRLGVLIMADVPNSWGEPTPEMHQEIEGTLRAMIRRDYNHPAVFSWIPFNETWGLYTNVPKPGQEKPDRVYKPETQQWVASVYRLAKSLDPDAARRRQLGLLREGPHRDRPQLVARLPARLGLGRGAGQGEHGHRGRLDLELRGRLQAGPPAEHQQRVRQRVGLRRVHGRRGLELGLSPRGQLVPTPSARGGLALHRAPRRHQRVERLLALRPFGEGHGPAGSRGGNDVRDLHTPLYIAVGCRRTSVARKGGGDGGGAAVGVVPHRQHGLR
jgi:hypothetical protein